MSPWTDAQERQNRESIIRDTITRHARQSGLRETEIETATQHGMAISDSQRGLNWGQIADAAIAVTKEQHS